VAVNAWLLAGGPPSLAVPGIPDPSFGLWGAILGYLLVVALPGFALGMALLPQRGTGWAVRLALSLGLGMASAALAGLLLDRTIWGLAYWPWVVYITSALALGVVTSIRRGIWKLAPRIRRPFSVGRAALWLRLRWQSVLLSALTLGVLSLAVILAYQGAINQQYASYSQLWAVRDRTPGSNIVTFGVQSGEKETIVYSLSIEKADGSSLAWNSIELIPGQTWTTQLDVPRCSQDCEGKLTALATLYREDEPGTPYRIVWLRR
jgi:uncharacterized membrane protein